MVVLVAVDTVGGRHHPPLTHQAATTEGREGGRTEQEVVGRPAINHPGVVGQLQLPRPPAGWAAQHGVVGGQLGAVVSSTHDPL